MRVGFIKFFLLCSVLFTSVIGVTAMAEERDPWEKWNRKVFEFNDTLDAYALKAPFAIQLVLASKLLAWQVLIRKCKPLMMLKPITPVFTLSIWIFERT